MPTTWIKVGLKSSKSLKYYIGKCIDMLDVIDTIIKEGQTYLHTLKLFKNHQNWEIFMYLKDPYIRKEYIKDDILDSLCTCSWRNIDLFAMKSNCYVTSKTHRYLNC